MDSFRAVRTSFPRTPHETVSSCWERCFSVSHVEVGARLGQAANIYTQNLAHPKSVEVNEAKKWRGDESVVTDGPAAACPGR